MLEITNDDEDYQYFGEFGQKLRTKETGHTRKHRYDQGEVATTIERSNKHNNSNGGNQYFNKLQEVAVTDIDSMFDYGFTKGQSRAFNTPERWEDVETLLEENAVKISKEYNRYKGNVSIHYDIPIVGHMLYPNTYMMSKKKKIEDNWFFWNGKYYNPNFIYQFISYSPYRGNSSYIPAYTSYCVPANSTEDHGNTSYHTGYLKQICPMIQGGKDPQMALGKINDRQNRIASATLTKKNKDFVQIDLGRVCQLTHIGTLGGYPVRLRHFPFITQEAQYLMTYYNSHGKRRRRRYKNHPYVYVIEDEGELAWVTRYKIEYRDLVTGKWFPYETMFQGNTDVGTENIHKISLVTRYLRITPLDFHHSKRMRINLYGEGLKSELKEGELEVETIRYTVCPPSSSKMLDGYGNGRCNCCYYPPAENKKISMYKLVRDEISSYYDSMKDDDEKSICYWDTWN